MCIYRGGRPYPSSPSNLLPNPCSLECGTSIQQITAASCACTVARVGVRSRRRPGLVPRAPIAGCQPLADSKWQVSVSTLLPASRPQAPPPITRPCLPIQSEESHSRCEFQYNLPPLPLLLSNLRHRPTHHHLTATIFPLPTIRVLRRVHYHTSPPLLHTHQRSALNQVAP